MHNRRAFLTVVSACATVSLGGCAEDESSPEQSDPESESEPESNSTESEGESEPESSTEQPESESEPETESGIDDDSRSELGPIEVTEQFFAAAVSGNETKIYELSHPEVRDILIESYSEPQNLGVDTIEQVSEEEATTGEQSAPEMDIAGVEELLAGDMATEVQWVLVTFSDIDGEFYVPLLKYDGSWFYYEDT